MEFVLRSIAHAANTGNHLPAVMTALTVPDIAGAVEAPEASGSKKRYADWIDKWFIPSFPSYSQHQIDGLAMYSLRCKLLHEGLSSPADAPAAAGSAAASHKRLIAFNVGGNFVMHLCSTTDGQGDSWTVLNTQEFCREMIVTAQAWMASKAGDPVALERLRALVDVRTSVPPISEGVPLICAAIEMKT